MSKKECKRVPSYAIRHLIQSLKEKGRTCRKGAEQRIDREILICDPEEEYVRRLAEALLLKKEVTAGVRICSSPEMVQELLKIGLIKVLLISEDVPYEKRKQIFTGKRIILTRQHAVCGGCICDGKNYAVPAYVEGTAVSGAGVAYHVYQYGEKYASDSKRNS